MKIRRVLIYEGPREWVEKTMHQNWVQAKKPLKIVSGKGEFTVTEESWAIVEDEKGSK